MSFAKRLFELRKGQGLSQEKLAEMVGLHRVTIVNYEKGEREPEKLEILIRLAEVLNATTDYLLGHTDERFPATIAEARERYLVSTGNPREDNRRRQLLELLDQRGRTMNLDQLEAYVDALDKLMQLARKAAKDDEGNSTKQ